MTIDAQRLEMIRANAQFAEGREAGESIVSFYNIAVNYVAAGKLSQREGGEAS